MDRELLLKNLDAEQRLEFSKILDGVSICLKQREPVFSGFLDPIKAEKFVCAVLYAKNSGVNATAFGGYPQAERKMICLCPDYMEADEESFPIDVVEVAYNPKFGRELTHRDFLGAVLALGIDRNNVGDIITHPGLAYTFIHKKLSGYVCANIYKVGATSVRSEIKPAAEVSLGQAAKQAKTLTLASLRLDSLVSACFRVSRSEAAALIAAEKVFVNWVPITSASKHVAAKDVITVRGKGRVEIGNVTGTTKKGRIALEIFVFT